LKKPAEAFTAFAYHLGITETREAAAFAVFLSGQTILFAARKVILRGYSV
jgi:hypothetical protein